LTVQILVTAAPAGTPTLFGLSVSAGISSATWDFGDGSPAVTTTSPTTSYAYPAGTFTVSVIVTDVLGRTASSQATVMISPAAVVPYNVTVNCTAQLPTVATPCTAVVKDGSTDVTSRFVNFVWKFGDGSMTATVGPSTVHPFALPGTYTVSASVEDGTGRTGASSQAVIILAPSYSVTLTASPTSVFTGASSTLTATVTANNGAPTIPTSFAWDCTNDGTVDFTTGVNTQACVYPTAGTITAKVTVTNGTATGSGTTTVTVTTPPPPTVAINCSLGAKVAPPTPSTCVAVATVNGVVVPASRITQVVWDFGDATAPVTTGGNVSAPHQYVTANSFTVFGTATITGVTGTVTGSVTTTVAP
jgi:PKD repeat protein